MQLDNSFWRFSVAVYGKEGIAPRLLELQGRHGLNVNLALLAIWLGYEKRYLLEAARLNEAIEELGGWHETVVVAVRNQRRRLGAEQTIRPERTILRKFVTGIELDCEKVEQALLYHLFKDVKPTGDSSRALAEANLHLVLGHGSGTPIVNELCDRLADIFGEGDRRVSEISQEELRS